MGVMYKNALIETVGGKRIGLFTTRCRDTSATQNRACLSDPSRRDPVRRAVE